MTREHGNPSPRRSLPLLPARPPPAALDALLEVPSADEASPAPREASGPWRTSSYTIYVDLPDDAGATLLVHSYSGAFDRVSRAVATYLRSCEVGPAPKPLHGDWSPEAPVERAPGAPTEATLRRLRQRGYLTRMTREEEETYFKSVVGRLHDRALRGKPQYILMPTYDCNLRCAYCFQDAMRTDPGKAALLRDMTPEMVDRIFRGFDRIDEAHGIGAAARLPRAITLFGGEPLLARNRPTIDRVFRNADATGGADVSAVTNATELEAYEDLLGPGRIATLQITIDGPRSHHDRRRIYADGSGSFDRIARNLERALARGAQVSLRMNVDRANVAQLHELAEDIVRRGWAASPLFSAYVAAVHDSVDQVEPATMLGTWQLRGVMSELSERFPEMRLFATQDAPLERMVRRIFDHRADALPSFKAAFCSAHTTMYVIDAFADVYACWERTGDPAARIGAIAENGDVWTSSATFPAWRRRNAVSNPVCTRCRYATYCGGGCAAMAEEQHGDMFGNHCAAFGKRFRGSVAAVYRQHVDGATVARDGAVTCDV